MLRPHLAFESPNPTSVVRQSGPEGVNYKHLPPIIKTTHLENIGSTVILSSEMYRVAIYHLDSVQPAICGK